MCTNLERMTIPDSLQTIGKEVFFNCFMLVPETIDVENKRGDATSEVIPYLPSATNNSLNAR